MDIETTPRPIIKACIEMEFGSVAAFERALDLPEKSVHDVLRGRPNARVKAAILKVLAKGVPPQRSELSDSSRKKRAPHRLSAGAK